jgi:spore coat polysaccharide biosynthesis protein SpsF
MIRAIELFRCHLCRSCVEILVMKIKAFIQARMSSTRFPGKVLAPLGGRPMISWVIERVGMVLLKENIIVATSDEESDDPLACYVGQLDVKVFRGPLDNVFERFRLCLAANPCEWFFRISADSPLLNSGILKTMVSYADESLDLVTNVQKRTFPHGHSVELLNAMTFAKLDSTRLSMEDCEHVTKFYYSHSDEFRILNLENMDADYAKMNFVVDTFDDLRRIEEIESKVQYDFIPQVKVTVP